MLQGLQNSNPLLFQTLPKTLLSPIPIRTNPFIHSSKQKTVSKSIDYTKRKYQGPCKINTNESITSKNFLIFTSKTSSYDTAEKHFSMIDQNDLNGLMVLRQDSQNPQEKDDCFRCINFDDIENVRNEVNETFNMNESFE